MEGRQARSELLACETLLELARRLGVSIGCVVGTALDGIAQPFEPDIALVVDVPGKAGVGPRAMAVVVVAHRADERVVAESLEAAHHPRGEVFAGLCQFLGDEYGVESAWRQIAPGLQSDDRPIEGSFAEYLATAGDFDEAERAEGTPITGPNGLRGGCFGECQLDRLVECDAARTVHRL